jgi:hypothetical protein
MRRAPVALLLLATLPAAAALDAFPGETRWGAREATFVVRAQEPWTVRAPPGVVVENVTRDWHGLPGAVEMRATRPDGRAATIEIVDATGTGVDLEWPADAPRHVPAPGGLALAALLVGVACGLRRARRPGSRP